MVSDTRSARKARDGADDQNLKKKVNTQNDSSMLSPGKAEVSGVRRSTREISSSKQSPQITRKSKGLEQEMPPVTPPVKRKSERLDKNNTPTPPRKSDRVKKNLASSSKQSAKEVSPSGLKRKKEKTIAQVTMESEKVELELEEIGMKRKKMSSRTFKGLFKSQRIREIVTDGDRELGPDKISQVCSDNMVFEAMGNGEDLSDEHSGRIVQILSNGSIDKAESESSASSARSSDSSVSPESKDKYNHPKGNTCSSSSKCKIHNLVGTCSLCSKNKRTGHDSPEQELCSCSPTVDEDRGSFSCCKDRSDDGAAVTSECDYRYLSTEMHADSQMDSHENVCALCGKDGELLLCVGTDCKGCYHPNCLDPPLCHTPPGVWHCPECVKKKLLFGVHSVTQGVESIWDVREVKVSNDRGVGQRQYLVKYHGLAHVHNHWVAEKQLLLENSSLVSDFVDKNQTVRWNAEWMVPHRLLRKRSIQDKIYIASSDVISVCNNEWLVKWCGLSYDFATWELENAHFLSSSLGQNLMKDYETRHEKAKQEFNKSQKGSIVKLSELPASRSDINDSYVLHNVNKLRECLSKCKNAVIFDDQEQAMTVILSIGSMSQICQPFLIVTAPSSLFQWEAEFAQLMPSVNVVVCSGEKETRKQIISSEFYEEGGGLMLQVLVSSIEAVFEDIDVLRGIKWEGIVIDEYQHAGISNDLEQIKMLSTDSRILLVNGQIEDSTSEYLKILSFLESDGDYDKLSDLKSETNENLIKLKDSLSRFVVYGSTPQVSKFLEYWIPVHLSNYQLEQYCDTLLSNFISLCSTKKNLVAVLPDVLLNVRKCCNHPYLLDSSLSLQDRLVAEKRTQAELLEIGIEASGKLQLLDMMLKDIQTRGLQVLVLFQFYVGPRKISNGNMLDDYLRQRFGPNSFERVESGVIHSKKQAVVDRFNKKENGQFVFLLENRACNSIVKLSPLDIIIIYDSDWNPENDLRALQKISIDSKVEQIKVFRLYSSFTVEEKALVLAKKTLSLINFNRTISHTLSWGATYLFKKLEEYHATESVSDPTLALNSSSGKLHLNEVSKEFQAILSGNCDNIPCFLISKVKLGVGCYCSNMSLFGEARVGVKNGEEPHVFWKTLLDGKNPHWRYLEGPSPRTRKRAHVSDLPVGNAENEKDDVGKKRRKVVNESSDPALVQVAVSKEGPSTIKAYKQSAKVQRDGITSNNNPNSLSAQSSLVAEKDSDKERITASDEQKCSSSFLQGKMSKLCQILKLSDDVTLTVGKFLEYVTKNHHVDSNSPSILEAFQLSLCWIAASITKQKVDKKDSLKLVKELLDYQCTEEQVNSVYLKMRVLKKMFLQCSENAIYLGRHSSLAEENIGKDDNNNEGGSQFSPSNGEHAEKDSEIDNKIKKLQKKCDRRMKKLILKHQEEIQEFHKVWEEKRSKMESDHKLETAFIRNIHGQGSVALDKLKLSDKNFSMKTEEHNLLKEVQLKDLEKEQLATLNNERQKAADWLARAKACLTASKSLSTQGNDYLTPSVSSLSTPAEAIGLETPVEKLATANLQNEVTEMPLERSSEATAEHLNQIPEEVRTVDLSEEVPVEAARTPSNENVGNVHTEELSNASNKESHEGSKSALPDALGQQLVQSEQTEALPDSSDLLPQQVQQDMNVDQSFVSAVPQNIDTTPAVENETLSTSRIEVAASAPDTVTPTPSDLEEPTTDEIPVVSNHEEVSEDHDQRRSSSQTAEPVGMRVLSHESISQHEENMGIRSGEQSVELRSISHNDVANQPVHPLGIGGEHLNAQSYLFVHPTQLSTSSSSTSSLLADPLHNELERLRKETQQLDKSHEDMISQLKSDCEKEILEVIAQIRHKYELKRLESEGEFRLRRNELDKIQSKLLMNRILAEAFRSKCVDVRSSGIPALNLGVPSSFMQHLHQVSSHPPPPMRPPSCGPSPSPLAPAQQQIPPPSVPTVPLSYDPQFLRTSSPVPTQAVQHTAPLRSSPFTTQSIVASAPPPPAPSPNPPAPAQQQITPPSVPTVPVSYGPQFLRTSSPVPTQAVQHTAPLRLSSVTTQSIVASAPPPPASAVQHTEAARRSSPVQAVQHASALFSSAPTPTPSPSPSRPPLIGALTHAAVNNPRVGGGDVRAMAPHLQSSRPPAATSPPVSQLGPPQMLPPAPPRPPVPNSVFRTQPSPSLSTNRPLGQPNPSVSTTKAERPVGPPNPSLSTMGLLVDMDQRPTVTVAENRSTSSPLPDICPTFQSLEISDLEILGNVVQGSQTSAGAQDVVCLSDDD